MDAWMQVPGARVVGHRAVVRGDASGSFCDCTCGFQSQVSLVVDASCLALAAHLQHCVRLGVEVVPGEDGGEAGAREPRRPAHPPGSLFAEAELPGADRSA